jgi:hypothetical protein
MRRRFMLPIGERSIRPDPNLMFNLTRRFAGQPDMVCRFVTVRESGAQLEVRRGRLWR